ncbi:hypothetical protein MBLNU459_g5874t1 [Dothideomycetes sp. NU459]
MGCFGDGEKGPAEESQKWAYVTLSDFHANGILAYLSYAWLWFLAVVAVAVYAADTFTAVNLLAFDKWSSEIQPAIPFKYSKWIFAVCIIISWSLCAFEWVRAIRVIRRGGVAESYMDSLAVTLQSMRPQGWKRFLVFAELTKSKKGVDYVALFVYFQFKGAIRVILAEGARQVVNALTLYSVMQADFVPTGDHAATEGHSSIVQFFVNIKTLAESDKEQAVVLFSMLFTLVIWVISALSLIAALVMYIMFLWHYVPQADGRLSIYCRRKIDGRLEKIVGQKVKKALEDQEKKRLKEEARAVKKGDLPARPVRQPTLPQLGEESRPSVSGDDKMPRIGLVRQDTQTTLPSYASRPPTRNEAPGLQRQPTLPDVQRPGMPFRSDTEASAMSNTSFSSNAPLLGNATDMGYVDCNQNPNQPRSALDRNMSSSTYASRPSLDRNTSSSTYASRPPPIRTMTQSSQRSQNSQYRPGVSRAPTFGSEQYRSSPAPMSTSPVQRENSGPGPYGPPVRQNTQDSIGPRPYGPLSRQNTQDSLNSRLHGAPPRQNFQESITRPEYAVLQRSDTQTTFHRPFSPPVRTDTGMSNFSHHTLSPGPEQQGYEMTAQPTRIVSPLLTVRPSAPAAPPPPPSTGGYVAFNPSFAITPSQGRPTDLRRNITSPLSAGPDHVRAVPQRSATAPPDSTAYEDLIDDYGDSRHDISEMRPPPIRSATAGPDERYPGRHVQW